MERERKETRASFKARCFGYNPALREEININTRYAKRYVKRYVERYVKRYAKRLNQSIPFQSGSFNKASQGSCGRKWGTSGNNFWSNTRLKCPANKFSTS